MVVLEPRRSQKRFSVEQSDGATKARSVDRARWALIVNGQNALWKKIPNTSAASKPSEKSTVEMIARLKNLKKRIENIQNQQVPKLDSIDDSSTSSSGSDSSRDSSVIRTDSMMLSHWMDRRSDRIVFNTMPDDQWFESDRLTRNARAKIALVREHRDKSRAFQQEVLSQNEKRNNIDEEPQTVDDIRRGLNRDPVGPPPELNPFLCGMDQVYFNRSDPWMMKNEAEYWTREQLVHPSVSIDSSVLEDFLIKPSWVKSNSNKVEKNILPSVIDGHDDDTEYSAVYWESSVASGSQPGSIAIDEEMTYSTTLSFASTASNGKLNSSNPFRSQAPSVSGEDLTRTASDVIQTIKSLRGKYLAQPSPSRYSLMNEEHLKSSAKPTRTDLGDRSIARPGNHFQSDLVRENNRAGDEVSSKYISASRSRVCGLRPLRRSNKLRVKQIFGCFNRLELKRDDMDNLMYPNTDNRASVNNVRGDSWSTAAPNVTSPKSQLSRHTSSLKGHCSSLTHPDSHKGLPGNESSYPSFSNTKGYSRIEKKHHSTLMKQVSRPEEKNESNGSVSVEMPHVSSKSKRFSNDKLARTKLELALKNDHDKHVHLSNVKCLAQQEHRKLERYEERALGTSSTDERIEVDSPYVRKDQPHNNSVNSGESYDSEDTTASEESSAVVCNDEHISHLETIARFLLCPVTSSMEEDEYGVQSITQ